MVVIAAAFQKTLTLATWKMAISVEKKKLKMSEWVLFFWTASCLGGTVAVDDSSRTICGERRVRIHPQPFFLKLPIGDRHNAKQYCWKDWRMWRASAVRFRERKDYITGAIHGLRLTEVGIAGLVRACQLFAIPGQETNNLRQHLESALPTTTSDSPFPSSRATESSSFAKPRFRRAKACADLCEALHMHACSSRLASFTSSSSPRSLKP